MDIHVKLLKTGHYNGYSLEMDESSLSVSSYNESEKLCIMLNIICYYHHSI